MSSLELLDRPLDPAPEAEWQSDAAFAEIEPRMLAFDALSRSYYVPVVTAVKEEYGRHKCGASSILLASLVGEDTSIPTVHDSSDRALECIEVKQFLRNCSEEHTLFVYNTGKGFSLSLDPVFRLIWGNDEVESDALQVEWHYDHTVHTDLHELYRLQPALFHHRANNQFGFWKTGQHDSVQDLVNMHHIFNSPAVFEDVVIAPSGEVVDLAPLGSRLAKVRQRIREQIPLGTLSLDNPTL